jgi:hypothetical protein
VNLLDQLSDHPVLNSYYRDRLSNLILDTLRTTAMEFGTLVANAEGAYPTDILIVLKELEADNKVLEADGLWFLHNQQNQPHVRQVGVDVNMMPQSVGELPEPHPLDFDWRFTDDTLANLERILETKCNEGAILGAPTLYKYLSDIGATVSLFDKNPAMIEYFKSAGYVSATQVDLVHAAQFPRRFRWALADPPWYDEHYTGFLSAASKLLLPHGKLFLSMLPRLTRPSAAEDRFRIVERAHRIGFDLVDISPAALAYTSPPFEIAALREAGFVLSNWRKGDLFAFVLSPDRRHEDCTVLEAHEAQWKTIHLGTTIIRVRLVSTDNSVDFRYRSASSTGSSRLQTVSRRSPARLDANVWNSRNIALVVSRPDVLSNSLISIADGGKPTEVLNRMSVTHQLDSSDAVQLREVVELLLQDAGLQWN